MLQVFTFYVALTAMNAHAPMMQFVTLLMPLHEMLTSMWKEMQLHVLPSTTFDSSSWRIDIVLTKNEICTLTNIVIADPTQVDLFCQFCFTQGFVACKAVQACRNPTLREVWGHHSQSRKWDLKVLRDSRKLRVRLQGSKGILYTVGKVLKCRCPNWPRMSHLDICNTSYGRKKGH
jgi:hypothetical protein